MRERAGRIAHPLIQDGALVLSRLTEHRDTEHQQRNHRDKDEHDEVRPEPHVTSFPRRHLGPKPDCTEGAEDALGCNGLVGDQRAERCQLETAGGVEPLMDKLFGGGLPDDLVDLDEAPATNLKNLAKTKKLDVSDLVV